LSTAATADESVRNAVRDPSVGRRPSAEIHGTVTEIGVGGKSPYLANTLVNFHHAYALLVIAFVVRAKDGYS
jgi:hypothetical protein